MRSLFLLQWENLVCGRISLDFLLLLQKHIVRFIKTKKINAITWLLRLVTRLHIGGYITLPGGIVIQWGLKTPSVSGANNTWTMFRSFGNTNYSLLTCPQNKNEDSGNPVSYLANVVSKGIQSVTTFSIRFAGSSYSGSATQFAWLAIGKIS